MDNNSIISKGPGAQHNTSQVRAALYLAQQRQTLQEIQDIDEKCNILQTRMEINSLLRPLISKEFPGDNLSST